MSFNNDTEFEIFAETALTKRFPKQFPLQDLIDELKKSARMLEKFIPNQLGVPIPIVMCEGDLSIALALPIKVQGSLLGGSGIGESARQEVLEQLKIAEKISASSINVGKKIAQKLEQKNMSMEEFAEEVRNAPDEMVARATVDQERKAPMRIDFRDSSQTVGNNRKGPDHVVSERKIKYTQCVAKQNFGDGEFELDTPDYLKTNDNSLAKNNLFNVYCDHTSPDNIKLIGLAHIFKASFGCDAVIQERLATKKRKIRVMRVESVEILEVSQANLDILKENALLDF